MPALLHTLFRILWHLTVFLELLLSIPLIALALEQLILPNAEHKKKIAVRLALAGSLWIIAFIMLTHVPL